MVVVGPVAGLARELVHVRRPAGLLDGGDAHGIDLAGTVGFPFFGRLVHDVALAERADFGVHGFLLFQQHAADFEVADLGQHGALHDGAAFVILDVAHPARFLQRNVLCEALLFEVADRVVVCVGEEMHYVRGCFDVVFEMRHHVRTVAFDLLVRRYGTEDYFGELAALEGTVSNATVPAVSNESIRIRSCW